MSDAAEEVQVKEGQATLYFASKKGVFYNPPQIPNRDLSVLALQQFSEMWASQPSKPAADRHRTLRQGSAPAPADAGAPEADVPEAAAAQEPPAPAAGEASETATAEAPASLPASASKPAARRGLRVLDALSASGLRTIRYAKEVSGLREVVANDVDPVAHQTMASNFGRNGLLEGGGEQSCRVTSTVGDAAALLYASRPPAGERFDVVDLDPYGTASPFLDGAVQAVSEGGLLMVTCTDMAVLAGAYPEACFAKYGAWPLKGKHCHEQGLRILLACIDSHAARHGRYITPLLSVHINFYVRVFVRLRSSKAAVKLSATKVSHLYQCARCDSFALQPLARVVDKGTHEKVVAGVGPPVERSCEHCGGVHHVGGPLWTAPMHDHEFVEKLLAKLQDEEGCSNLGSRKRLIGMLTSVAEELPDVPLFTSLSAMCGVMHLPCPQTVGALSALVRQGYRVSRSHTDPSAIKTDAPQRKVWDMLRCWAKRPECEAQKGKKKKEPLSPTSPAAAILAASPEEEADFRPVPEVQRMLSKKDGAGGKVGKFLPNPEQWGPGSRGTSHAAAFGAAEAAAAASNGAVDKRAENQGKRSRKRRAAEAAAAARERAAAMRTSSLETKW
mmetsp:Transcript_20755/g.67946  ORF Transcript_20755/g.67946 Transcript_20755/m.67946 type:complete len:616 (+) Transcript_20755:82-1929(+)